MLNLRNKRNKHMLAFILCFCMTMLLLPGIPGDSATVSAQSLSIPNSGFEVSGAGGQIPGWTKPYGASLSKIDSSKSYEGTSSVKLDNRSDIQQSVGVQSSALPATANKVYAISAQVYVDTGSPFLYMYFYDANGQLLKSYQNFYNVASSQWTKLQLKGKAPAQTASMKILLYGAQGYSNAFYFDKIEAMQQEGDVMITNGDFEEPLVNGQISGWTQTFGNGGITLDSAFGFTSNSSVKFDNRSHSQQSLGLQSSKQDITAGVEYMLSAQVYGVQGSPHLYLYFYDSQGNQLKTYNSYFDIPSDTWSKISLQGKAPVGAVKVSALLYAPSGYSGAFYFDKVSLDLASHTAVNLGIPIRTVAINGAAYGKGANGEDLTYVVLTSANSVLNIVDSHTLQVVKKFTLDGAENAYALTVAPDGTLYVGAMGNGNLYAWVPGSNTLQNLGRPIASEGYIMSLDTDAAGNVYGGTYPSGKVFKYTPATSTFHDYGTVASGYQYARSIAVSGNKIYVGLGTVNAKLYEINAVSGAKKEIVMPASHQNELMVYDLDLIGDKLFARVTESADLLVYNLTSQSWFDEIPGFNGPDVSSPDPQNPNLVYIIRKNGLYSYDMQTKTLTNTGFNDLWTATGYDWITLNDSNYPGKTLISIDYSGRMRYYNPATGNSKVVGASLQGEPTNIRNLGEGPDGRLYISGFLGGLAAYNGNTHATELFPQGTIGQGESMVTHGNKLYIGVYTGANIFEFDPSQPYDFGTNPSNLFALHDDGQDRPFAAISAGNEVAFGTVANYGQLDGALTLYNPATMQKKVKKAIVHNQGVVSLAYKNGKIYGGTTVSGGLGIAPTQSEAKLFIYDQASDTKVWEGVPVPGEKVIGGLAFDDAGYLWGITNGKLFKFDVNQKQVVQTIELYPFNWSGISHAWNVSRLYFQNGYLYGQGVGNAFKFDPQTMEWETLMHDVSNFLVSSSGELYFSRTAELFKIEQQ